MAIDASIYGQLRQPEPFNPLAEMAQFQQLQGVQNQNKLAALAFADRERALADAASQRAAVQGFGDDATANYNALLRTGNLGAAQGYQKGLAEQSQAAAATGKTLADTGKTQFEIADAKRRVAMQHLLSFKSPQESMASLEAAADIPPELKQQIMRAIPQDPAGFIDFQIRVARSLATPEQQAAGMEPKMMNAGGAWVNTNRIAGPTGQGAPNAIDITQSQDNAATQATALAGQRRMAADAAAGRGVQLQIAGMNDDRARELAAATRDAAAAKIEGKPLPPVAVKLQNEALTALGAFKSVDADLAALEKQVADGKLSVGPVNRAMGYVRSNINASTENDRNISTLKTKLEGMRNAILLMGKGVQTEGDANRAMDEILNNLNDQELLKQRLPELRAKLQRDAQLQKNNVDLLRSNYGHEGMDFSKYDPQPASVNLPPKPGKRAKTGSGATASNW